MDSFVAATFEFTEVGMRVADAAGNRRFIPFGRVEALVGRQLPWEHLLGATVFLDVVPCPVAST